VLDYAPDRPVERDTELTIGGTRIRLLLARGGETHDAMLVHLPELGVLFVGDVLMPYLGAPFLPEGDVDGLLAAMQQLRSLQPRVMLHGHEPLTRVYARAEMLGDLHDHLEWLRDQVAQAMQRGAERSAIHAANLMPPALERSNADVQLAYLVLRENFINRVYQQRSGYWQLGLHGLDALTDADRGDALANYLHLGERQIGDAAQRLVADGKHELAAELLRWAQPQWPSSPALRDAQTLANLKLMEKYQDFSPFKFNIYGAQIERATAQIDAPLHAASR
jgi:alkyl sulfatase BDS1-like metallo-beta-lactamase superfamily hydrolase